MSSPQQERMEKAVEKAITEPSTLKDRIIAIVIALALTGFGAATWLWPDYVASQPSTPSGGRGSRYHFVLWLLWNRPVGSIAGLLGLSVLWGAFTKKGRPETGKSDAPNTM